MKKPAVVVFLQICLVLIAISYTLDSLGSLIGLMKGSLTAGQGIGGLIVGIAVGGAAIFLYRQSSRQSASRRAAVLYIWIVFFAYPLSRALANFGLFPPPPQLQDNELAGAAAYEIIRSIGLLTLIIWLSFSKRAAAYLPAALASEENPASAEPS